MPWLWSRLKLLDWWIMVSVVILMALSVIMLWSMSAADGSSADLALSGRFLRQLAFCLVTLAMILGGTLFLDVRTLERVSSPLYIISLVLLVWVLVGGEVIRGTRGWLVLGPINIQPVEFAKLGFVLFFATTLKRWARHLKELRALFVSALSVALIGGLVLLQPDFGSFFVFLAVWLAMIATVGLKKSHAVVMVLLTIASGVLAWYLFAPYQRDRLKEFLTPNRDPQGRGYQLRQSMIAVGSGGITGRGLGLGSQSQLRFLPERQTDFLFAVIAEELGFIGVGFILLLWGTILVRLLYWARVVTDDFALFTMLGITLLMTIQVTMVIGMNIGLLPITGLALPLMSYGGSSMISTGLLLMVAQCIAVQSTRSGWGKKYQ